MPMRDNTLLWMSDAASYCPLKARDLLRGDKHLYSCFARGDEGKSGLFTIVTGLK